MEKHINTENAECLLSVAVERLNAKPQRSAWNRGVSEYAREFLSQLSELAHDGYITRDDLTRCDACRRAMLNGAENWAQYSWGGCSLIYNSDIAARLCTPSELKRTRNGERRPNKSEEWLDTQTRALRQAARRAFICITEAEGACAK